MPDMTDRIVQIVDDLCGGNRSDFARSINITPAYAAQLYTGARVPSDRTIADICRVLHVREQWLRTGTGSMMSDLDEDQEFLDIAAKISVSNDKRERRIRNLLRAYWDLPEEVKKAIDQLIDGLTE